MELKAPEWKVSAPAYCYECGKGYERSIVIAISEGPLVGEKMVRFDYASASAFAYAILRAIGEERT